MATQAVEDRLGDVSKVWGGNAVLGEGPVWDAARGVLWFVDIKQHRIHQIDPATGSACQWSAPEQIGWVLPTTGATLIAGLQSGLYRFDPADGSFTRLADVEPDLPGNRLNDSTTAADGSIWFGTMDDGEEACSGQFYRWDGHTVAPLAIDPVCITNGPSLSPDQTTLYHVDTVGGIVHASTFDRVGQVVATRIFAQIDPEDGHPDGCTTDSAGNVWLGLWGGWRARQYSPLGEILHEVRLPVSNVTKVALGGPDLKTAFVTTASAGLSDSERAGQPDAGCVFSFEVEVAGMAMAQARG